MITRTFLVLAALACWVSPLAAGEKLEVGPGKKYAKPSQAIAAAKDGDTIEIDTTGKYDGDVCAFRKNNLTIRGVGKGRAKIPAAGKHCQGKAIWVIQGKNTTVENIEFSGVRVPDGNGAGIRQEGAHLTLRNCKFHDCQDSILTNNNTPESVIVIEHCEFSYCSLNVRPTTHNLYIGRIKKLIYRFNYSHHAVLANVVKSRAAENHIMYNRLTAEADGGDSFVIDIPNGGKTYIVGNVLQKSPRANNRIFIAYGREGIKHAESELHVINNTMVNNLGKGTFVEVNKVKPGFKAVVKNNIFFGKGKICTWPTAVLKNNFIGGDPMFVDPEKWDYRLKKGSPCIDKGGKAGEVSLKPEFQYVHPHKKEKRPDDGKLDVGAFEFAEPKSEKR